MPMLFCLTSNLIHVIIYTDHRKTSNKKENVPMKKINTISELKKIISETSVPLYVRWSRGPAKDKKQGVSKDYQSGANHAGLSAIEIEQEWGCEDKYLARRINEYLFLRIKDCAIGCWIYTGERVGEDTDGYDSIINISVVARVSNKLIDKLQVIKNV